MTSPHIKLYTIMKPILFSFLLPTSLLAIPVNFDSMPVGSNPNGTYNNEVQITTSEEQFSARDGKEIVTVTGHTWDLTFGRTIVLDTYADAFNRVDPIRLTIGVQFLAPVDHFSVRLRDSEGSAFFHYTGLDGAGASFSGDLRSSNWWDYYGGLLDSSSLNLPPGGYFTGFTFEDADFKALLDLNMATFDYTVMPEGGVGLLVCAMTFWGLLVLRRRDGTVKP